VSNPPYIASPVIASLEAEVREHDPRRALDGGADGLEAYRNILADAARLLAPGGVLVVEIGYDQEVAVRGLAAATRLEVLDVSPDLSGHARCIALRPA
jgi:release factor glutamine methyltransferase